MLHTEHIIGSIWGTCKQPIFRKQRFYQTMSSIYCSQNNACTETDRRADGRHRDKITSHVYRSGMTRKGNDNEAVGKLIIFKEIKKQATMTWWMPVSTWYMFPWGLTVATEAHWCHSGWDDNLKSNQNLCSLKRECSPSCSSAMCSWLPNLRPEISWGPCGIHEGEKKLLSKPLECLM